MNTVFFKFSKLFLLLVVGVFVFAKVSASEYIVYQDTIYDTETNSGALDDTELINKLIEEAHGRVIKLQNRVYRINSISIRTDVEIVGGGNTIFSPVNQSKHLNQMFNVHASLSMSNVCLNGENRTAWGILAMGDLILQHVVIEDFRGTELRPASGIRHQGEEENSILRLDNCVIRNISGYEDGEIGNFVGAHRGVISRGGDVVITNCVFENILGQEDADCVHIQTSAEQAEVWSQKGNVIVDNCQFNNFGKRAVKIQASGVTVQNCVVNNGANQKILSAISIYGSRNAIINNFIRVNNGESAITVSTGTMNVVTNNKIIVDDELEDGKTWGIVVKQNNQDNISHNKFTIHNNRQFFYSPAFDSKGKEAILKANQVERIRK